MENENEKEQIFNDAENILIKNKYLIEIGTKIQKNSQHQFMGILKFGKIILK